MKEIKFVNAKDLTCLEEYGAALLSSMISLKTLESFHIAAFNKGLLDEDESETGKTICWEIQRLISLYKTQIENVLERTGLQEQDVLDALKAMMPNIKIRKTKKNKNDEKSNPTNFTRKDVDREAH